MNQHYNEKFSFHPMFLFHPARRKNNFGTNFSKIYNKKSSENVFRTFSRWKRNFEGGMKIFLVGNKDP
jgi:hypothetical protein